jgi:predicted HTH transcriptional regulator
MKIDVLLATPEGKRLEFKRDLSSTRPLLRTLCAFANTAGGTLVIGVDDDRSIRGLADPLHIESRLTNIVHDSITPSLVPEVDVIAWRSTHLVVVTVHLSSARPHRVTADVDTVYVRLGASNRRADDELIAEMKRSVRFESYDELPVPSEPINAVDLAAARAEFAQRRTIQRRDLRTLGLAASHQGREVPTVGGLVLFGRDRNTFPDASIRCARFEGTDRARILDTAEPVPTSLPSMVRDAQAFTERHMAGSILIAGLRNRIERPIPVPAIREALVNAAVHADYSQKGGPIRVALFDDRLEVENPGLLPFGVAVEDLTTGVSRVRNRVVARTFKELGYIEQWGSGITRMLDETRAAGLPQPTFEEIGGRFRVTLWATTANEPQLSPDQQRLLDALGRAGATGLATADLAAAIGRSTRTARTHMTRLVALGLAIEIGSGPTDPRRRYVRT